MPEIPLASGVTKMPDLDNDQLELLLDDSARSHISLMHDSRANEQSAHNILRHSATRKYNEVDPIEAAAAEMILQRNG